MRHSLSKSQQKVTTMIRHPYAVAAIANVLLSFPIASPAMAANIPRAAQESRGNPSDRLDHIHAWLQSLVCDQHPCSFATLVSRRGKVVDHLAPDRQSLPVLTVPPKSNRSPSPQEKFVRLVYAAVDPAATDEARAGVGDVVTAARAYSKGGGFNIQWKGSGTPRQIDFNGERLLAKGDGTYCCGYTFTVAMDVAKNRNLLKDKTFAQVRRFQKDWYGVSKESKETLCVHAVKVLGIGSAVDHRSAKAGDMVQFWRKNGSGHSVMFLNWVERNGKRIGLRYRSSQTATDGIGDRTEYFSDSTEKAKGIERKRTYFCRLDE
jgi:hypothetical protein